MKDFTKILPKKGYECWLDKLGKMSRLVFQVEHQTVADGVRDTAILRMDAARLYSSIEEMNKNGLIVTPLMRIEKTDCFSVVAKKADGPDADWEVCLTRNYQDGQKFKKAFIENDHVAMGKMLGYPDCCIKYFVKSFPVDYVPIWLGLQGKVKGYPETNGMLRYFGPKLTSHLSCSPRCKKTKEIGEIWLEKMKKIDKNLAEEMYGLLAGPVNWNSYHGVVQIETPYFVGLNSSLYLPNKPRIIDWVGA